MNIVFISAEVDPFSKTGGLGDVSSAFPKAMKELGHEIIVFTPLYKKIDIEEHNIKLVKKDLTAPIGDKLEIFELYESILPESQVTIYFIKNEYLYRDGIYVDEKTGEDYADSPIRFYSFSQSIFVSLKFLEFTPDIIHANDWHTGLIPFLLKTQYTEKPQFAKTKTVFTIHNIGYQGIYPLEKLAEAKIPEIYYSEDCLGFFNQINFMKAAIVYTDILTTVSSKYAEEIQTKEYGNGLEKFIEARKEDLYGIVHGIDLTVWNPKVDPLIVHNYDSSKFKGKSENKKYLQDKLNLNISDKPLIGVISRIATQKGLDLILEKFDDIMGLKVQFVLLGTGDSKLEKKIKSKEKNHTENCSINIEFDNRLAHQIEAGADFFLMPSIYEPCGLNQMYSMIYGTIPIVRNTGGLSDTVIDYVDDPTKGNGFVFENADAEELFEEIKLAVSLYYNDNASFVKLQKRDMNQDFSWNHAAKNWQKVYEKALMKRWKKK